MVRRSSMIQENDRGLIFCSWEDQCNSIREKRMLAEQVVAPRNIPMDEPKKPVFEEQTSQEVVVVIHKEADAVPVPVEKMPTASIVVEDNTESTLTEEDEVEEEPVIVMETPKKEEVLVSNDSNSNNKEDSAVLLDWKSQEKLLNRRRASTRKSPVDIPGKTMSIQDRMSMFQGNK
jgi:hypothetical protein